MATVTAWRSGVYHLLPCVIRTPKSEESYRRRNVWLLPCCLLKLPCIGLHRLLKFFKNLLITEAYRRTSSVNFLLPVIVSRFHRQLDVFLLALLCNSDVGIHKDTAFRSAGLLNALRTRSSCAEVKSRRIMYTVRGEEKVLYDILPPFVALSVKEISVRGTWFTDSGAAKDSRLVGMLRCVVEGVFPDVSKDRSAFDLRVKQKKSAFVKVLRSPETSGTTPPATRRNIPEVSILHISFNPLTPNDHYSARTAPLTSKRCILYIYSTNIGTECFKHGIYSPFFFS